MFISKKKHEHEVWQAKIKAMDNMREGEQSEKLWELEQDVRKLKKKIRKLENMVKNGY